MIHILHYYCKPLCPSYNNTLVSSCNMMQASTMLLQDSIHCKVKFTISCTMSWAFASTSWVLLLFLATFQNAVETMVSSLLIARYTNNSTNFSLKTDVIFICENWSELWQKQKEQNCKIMQEMVTLKSAVSTGTSRGNSS